MLADEMGLGKSLQALCTVAALDAWPCLVVVPAVTRRGWAEEAELHLGGLVTLHLTPTLTPTPSPNRTPTLTRYTKVPFETQLMVSNYNCDTMLEQYVATTRHPNPNPALTLTLTPPSP